MQTPRPTLGLFVQISMVPVHTEPASWDTAVYSALRLKLHWVGCFSPSSGTKTHKNHMMKSQVHGSATLLLTDRQAQYKMMLGHTHKGHSMPHVTHTYTYTYDTHAGTGLLPSQSSESREKLPCRPSRHSETQAGSSKRKTRRPQNELQ